MNKELFEADQLALTEAFEININSLNSVLLI